MTCDSSLLSSGTRRVWIIPQKRLSLQQCPWSDHIVGWSTAAHTLQPYFLLLLALSPSCLFSSICLPCPSPKEASIKSPLKTRTGLDSYKLEQNNLFRNPSTAPHLQACSCLSLIVSGRSRERCCETESSSCLLMHTILMWADSIRQHIWMPYPLPPYTASVLFLMFLPLMHLPWQDRLHGRQQNCSHCCCCWYLQELPCTCTGKLGMAQ